MKLCRFDDDRLGLVADGEVLDVTEALDVLPTVTWPVPPGDLLVANLEAVVKRVGEVKDGVKGGAKGKPIGAVKLLSPVANPTKVIGAPVNYQKHIDEARADATIHHGVEVKTIDYYGAFLKANSALVGPGEGVALRFTDRRNDHEAELAVIIGRGGSNIANKDAMTHVAGYAIGLDMTVRGTEDRSLRKSIDSYAVLGPWLVTADEIAEPGNLDFWIKVNGETRQSSNTSDLIYDIPKLIEYLSTFYTFYPGDVIMTGTPEGVAPVKDGDVMTVWIDQVGEMEVRVRKA